MRTVLIAIIISISVCSTALAQLGSNLRYVTAQTVSVRESTGFFSRETGRLSMGDEVVLLRETGRWSQIRAGNLTGWISSSVLSARRIIPSSSGASVTEVALAGKGFSPDIEIEYRSSGLDYSFVDAMENYDIPMNELLDFINQGRLARGD